ncbi:unnamed protein product [Musa banksii]|nr:PREDICTED: uncharacterized protein LOC108952863 [Musa acuminata subsp. malaccensis]
MAFLISQKPPSSSSSFSLTSTYGDENQLPAGGSPVTSCLYLKPDSEGSGGGAERKPLDRDVVLRRIRHRKRVNQIRTALHSLRELEPGVDKDGEPHAWLDDAFSSP